MSDTGATWACLDKIRAFTVSTGGPVEADVNEAITPANGVECGENTDSVVVCIVPEEVEICTS